jgi:hypothetical protein
MARTRDIAVFVAGGFVPVLAGAFGRYVWNTMTYADRDAAAAEHAGFVEKQTMIAGLRVNYAEGPADGPAMLLIHGQITDWRSWSRVLPRLADRYHVFAVDCY